MFIYTIGLFQKKIVHGGSKKSSKFALSEGVNLLCPGGKTYCPGGQKSPCPGGKSLKIVISTRKKVREIPYRGKLRRGKVTKIFTDEVFPALMG